MPSRTSDNAVSWAILVARVVPTLLLVYGHGWSKVAHFADRAGHFSNPIGLGSEASFVLVVFAEVVCSILVALGLFARPATIPLLIFFSVAIFVQHVHDPFPKRELPMLYAVPYLVVLITGPGRFSLDALIRKR
jgi:putative oxidoreductase